MENLGKEISVTECSFLSGSGSPDRPTVSLEFLCSGVFPLLFSGLELPLVGNRLCWPGLGGWSPTPVLGQVELGLRLGLGWDSEQGWAGGEATVMSFKSCITAG